MSNSELHSLSSEVLGDGDVASNAPPQNLPGRTEPALRKMFCHGEPTTLQSSPLSLRKGTPGERSQRFGRADLYRTPRAGDSYWSRLATDYGGRRSSWLHLDSDMEGMESGPLSPDDQGWEGGEEWFRQTGGVKEHQRARQGMAEIADRARERGCDKASTAVFTVFDSTRNVNVYRGLPAFLFAASEVLAGDFFWLDVMQPNEADLAVVQEVLGLHPLTAEDIATKCTAEKAESYDNYLFVVVQSLSSATGETENQSQNIYVAQYRDFVVTFHERQSQCIEQVLLAIGNADSYLYPDWVLYLVLDNVADELEPFVTRVELEVDAIDEIFFYLSEPDHWDILRRISGARKRVSKLTRMLKSKREILLHVGGAGHSGPRRVHVSTVPYLRDIVDLVAQMSSKLEISREVINSTQSNYLAQVSVSLGAASNQGNEALNKLTAVAGIFLPLNLVAGLWGMNVEVPWQFEETLVPFYCLLGVVAAIGLALLYGARRAGLV